MADHGPRDGDVRDGPAGAGDGVSAAPTTAVVVGSAGGGGQTTVAYVPQGPGPGAVIGRYRLLELVGEGGFGSVYMAEQTEPVRRRVALKLIKRGMDSGSVVARFESERQLLALMDHPNIARVYDAGATEDGRPYFVMELVRGEPITRYCDRNRLTVRERLGLFREVCEAVQHAHQKGVIHRDIKPSNVLVTSAGGTAHPKVIDFGVSKAVSTAGVGGGALGGLSESEEASLLSGYVNVVGTPEYMSPEQAELLADVDTRADVYSLGAVLYEVLTGVSPLDGGTLRSGALARMQRLIREVSPARPSERVGSLEEAAAAGVAGARGCDRRRLCAQLRDGLDWVVMKAIEKDRSRRYGSATELSEELRRWVERVPVKAAPATVGYRVGKFVSRNAGGVAFSAALALAVVGGLVGTTLALASAEARRLDAERMAARAKAVSDYFRGLLKDTDPNHTSGGAISVPELMDLALARIDEKLGKDEAAKGEVLSTIGAVYRGIDRWEDAETVLTRAVASLEGAADADAEELHAARMTRALVIMERGRLRQAEEELRRILDLTAGVFERGSEAELWTADVLATVLSREGREEESLALRRRVVEGRVARYPKGDRVIAISQQNLGFSLYVVGRYDEAEAALREALVAFEGARGVSGFPSEYWVALTAMNLSNVHWRQGRHEEAERAASRAVDIFRSQKPGGSRELGSALCALAAAQASLGRTEAALRTLGEAVPMVEAQFGEAGRERVLSARLQRGWTLGLSGACAEGFREVREAMEGLVDLLPAEHPRLRLEAARAAEACERCGEADAASRWRLVSSGGAAASPAKGGGR